MVRIKNFDENLERSLEKLGKYIEEKKAHPETESLSEKEIAKQFLKSLTPSPSKEDTQVSGQSVGEESVLPTYLQNEKTDNKDKIRTEIKNLVNLVFSRGLETALQEAGKHSPFIEDAFHDALVDKLLPELKKRGLIK